MLMIVLIAANVCFEGFVASKLWGWFLVPLGLPAILPAQAIGILSLASMVCFRIDRDRFRMQMDTEAKENYLIQGAYAFTFAMALLTGWIAHQFA
jgi:hypothetical protein